MVNGIKNQIRNFDKLQADIKKLETGSEKAVQYTISDMRTRAPGKVASAVAKVYNVKKKEISRGKKGDTEGHIGSTSIRGGTLDSLRLKYTGKKLIPAEKRFGLRTLPKKETEAPKNLASGKKTKKKNPVSPTAEVIKGHRESLGNGVFIAASKYDGRLLPFQRTGNNSIETIQTVSLAEMVENETVAADARAGIDEVLEERIKHHINRQLGVK